jgi:uncharacterized protein YegL
MTKNKVFILVDCSGSMSGAPIQQATQLVNELVQSLCNNTNSQKSQVSIITYNMEIKEIVSMSSVVSIKHIAISEECCGPKNLGKAIKYVNDFSLENKTIFIITKGKPSDVQLYNEQIKLCKNYNDNIIVIHGNIDKYGDTFNETARIVAPWDSVSFPEIIKSLFGGKEMTSSDGRDILQEPPKVIEINI